MLHQMKLENFSKCVRLVRWDKNSYLRSILNQKVLFIGIYRLNYRYFGWIEKICLMMMLNSDPKQHNSRYIVPALDNSLVVWYHNQFDFHWKFRLIKKKIYCERTYEFSRVHVQLSSSRLVNGTFLSAGQHFIPNEVFEPSIRQSSLDPDSHPPLI